MIGRIVWLAAIAAMAVLTTGLQLDKQAETTPALAPLVPAPLRNYAQTVIAITAVENGTPTAAMSEARRLVHRRPVPAEYLTVLALAQAKADKAEQAGISIQIAGQRGWREPLAQEAVLRLALANDDKAEAARRYAALFLRSETPDALLLELGPMIFGERGGVGEQTLTSIVTGGARWHTGFIRRGARVLPPDTYVAVARQVMAAGTRFDCESLAQALRALANRDRDAARALALAAAATCPRLAP
jgi:hypothetical protein